MAGFQLFPEVDYTLEHLVPFRKRLKDMIRLFSEPANSLPPDKGLRCLRC